MSSTEAEAVTRSIRRHLAIGMAVGLALIGAAGAWATTTQLAGAVVASGNFVVDSMSRRSSTRPAASSVRSWWRKATG